MSKARDIVSEALTKIADMWKVDHGRSIATDDGFDWWPGDYRVSVSATRRTDGYVPETWMLSVKTDFLKDVPIKNDRFVEFTALSSGVFATTYAWVYPPAEVWAHYGGSRTGPQLWFANTAYLTSENVSWLPRFLAEMSIMQPINARMAALMQTTLGGGVPNVSSPTLLSRSQTGNLLDETAGAYSSIGSTPNKWVATGEFERLAEGWDRVEHCSCGANDRELALDTGLGDGNGSPMIRLLTHQPHPQLGNGLVATLTLPIVGDMKSIVDRCASLNLRETMWTDIPQFGCWYPVSLEDNRVSPNFASFIPNALYGKGIAGLMVLWLYQRARWVLHGEYPT